MMEIVEVGRAGGANRTNPPRVGMLLVRPWLCPGLYLLTREGCPEPYARVLKFEAKHTSPRCTLTVPRRAVPRDLGDSGIHIMIS